MVAGSVSAKTASLDSGALLSIVDVIADFSIRPQCNSSTVIALASQYWDACDHLGGFVDGWLGPVPVFAQANWTTLLKQILHAALLRQYDPCRMAACRTSDTQFTYWGRHLDE